MLVEGAFDAGNGFKRDALVVVYCLALVVVFRADHPRFRRDGLRGFFGLESLEQFLLALGFLTVAKPTVAEHRGVMHLHVFGIDRANPVERLDGLGVVPLEKKDACDLVENHPVAREVP